MTFTPKVFISATSSDLREIREIVKEALLSRQCLPVVQEHFRPDYRTVADMLKHTIADCHAVIHIAGLRYGAEPDPSSLPSGTPRRSFTQMELDLARANKSQKVFTFVCSEDFPFATEEPDGSPLQEEPQELTRLQQEHRKQLLGQPEVYHQVARPEDLAARIREIDLPLDQLKSDVKKRSRRSTLALFGLIAALIIVASGVVTLIVKQRGQQTVAEEILRSIDSEPAALADKLRQHIEAYAAAEIDQNRDDWRAVQQIEQERDRQLRHVDELIQNLRDGLAGDPFPAFSKAARILAAKDKGGPDEALAYLQAEQPDILSEADRLSGLETELRARKREVLRPLLLKAELQANRFEWQKALETLSTAAEKAPDWWQIQNRLGNLLHELADFENAEVHLRLGLDIAEGDEQMAASTSSLAGLLASQGRFAEADPLFAEALRMHREQLGADHPDTLASMSSFARVLQRQGKVDEAESLFQEALNGCVRVLGRTHPDSVFSINSMAGFFQSQSRFADAEPLFREALKTRTQLLGREHPTTLLSISNLASCLRSQEKFQEAETLYRECISLRTQVLKRSHPETLRSINGLAKLLLMTDRTDEAEPLFREAFEGFARAFGDDHPQTVSAKNNLAACTLN